MQGDAINAILCGAGHNLRKIMEALLAKLEHSIGPQEALVVS